MKCLIVRFSSFGDILQCFPAAEHLKNKGFERVDWLTREDFSDLVRTNTHVDGVIAFSRSEGFFGLIKLAFRLRRESYSLVYDAHNNLRSHILTFILRWNCKLIRRKKFRLKRFLLFRFQWNLFKNSLKGQNTYLEPLGARDLEFKGVQGAEKQNYVALVPGAAWQLKQWPVEKWLETISQFPEENFVILGGKSDEICFEIEKRANSNRIQNLAGKLNLVESVRKIQAAKYVVANDTGLLHAADLAHVPTVALIGPSAFGYPSSRTSTVVETKLWCKPCSKDGRGKCKNAVYQKCMKDIQSEEVVEILNQMKDQVL